MVDQTVRAVILAGGKGKRMRSELPKVLHEIHGKSVTQLAAEHVRATGVGEVIVVVGYGRDLVMALLAGQVQFAVQEAQLGTGHAVQQTLPLLADAEGPVVVYYRDIPLLIPGAMSTAARS